MKSEHLFLIRQLANLVKKGKSIEDAFYDINQVTKSGVWQRVYANYQQTGNLQQALSYIPEFGLSLVADQLRHANSLNIPASDVLSKAVVNESRSLQMASIVKGRLVRSASYAAIVGLVALSITVMFAIYVAPMFEDLFQELPEISSNLINRLEGLTLNSWLSVLYYLPPIILILIFAYFSLTPTNKLLFNSSHSKLPFLRPIQKQLARSYFVNNIWEHRDFITESNNLEETFDSSFFSTENYKFSQLFSYKEQNQIRQTFQLGTQETELPILVADIETETIESTNKRTSTLSTVLLLLMFFIVANLVYTIYIPIFQLGAVF